MKSAARLARMGGLGLRLPPFLIYSGYSPPNVLPSPRS